MCVAAAGSALSALSVRDGVSHLHASSVSLSAMLGRQDARKLFLSSWEGRPHAAWRGKQCIIPPPSGSVVRSLENMN